MYILAIAVLSVVDLTAMAAVLAVFLKIRALKTATFWRGCLGGLAAMPIEVVRILFGAWLVQKLGVKGDDLLLLLLNMRMFNMPFLIGFGFLGAAFAEPLDAKDARDA